MLSPELPGSDLVVAGLADLATGRETEAALLVALAAPRISALGLIVPGLDAEGDNASAAHRLYSLLAEAGPGAHGRYNALVRRVVSYAQAAEHAAAG